MRISTPAFLKFIFNFTGMIKRSIEKDFIESLRLFPVTGVIGPRQVGKTTLVKSITYKVPFIYLDLERNSDLNKLSDPELFFSQNLDKTIILDEIHHLPSLFPIIRAMVDEDRRPGRFVILGSAAPTLLLQSTESLAGRINYLEMTPLNLLEISDVDQTNSLWINGGFPEPFLSTENSFSHIWYRNFVNSYIQRDLPQYGLPAEPRQTRQLMMMIANAQGGPLNYSAYSKALGLSNPTVKTYMSFLIEAFLLRELPSWHVNLKKRLVKSPKLYYRDTGMLHYLTGIQSMNDLFGNILLGSSWEAFVINQAASVLPQDCELYYYRTQDGAEIDLLIRRGNQWLSAVEIKFSLTPKISKGTFLAMDDLGIEHLHVVIPKEDSYPIAKNVTVVGIVKFLKELESLS